MKKTLPVQPAPIKTVQPAAAVVWLFKARHFCARHWLFLSLFTIGSLLRILAETAYHPAILGYGDSYFYLADAQALQPNSLHPLGYSVFLRLLAWTGNLMSVTIVQHVLGLLAAFLIYRLFMRFGVNRLLAAAAAAPLLLDAYVISFENFILSEALVGFLFIAIVVLLFWSKRPRPVQLVGLGLALAAAAITRSDAAIVAVPVEVYLLLSGGAHIRQRVLSAAVVLLAFLVPVAAYGAYHARVDGAFAIDSKTGLFLYGRLAPIANCSLLSGEQKKLCDPQPVQKRQGPIWYIWSSASPVSKVFGYKGFDAPEPPLIRFDVAVLKNQWGEYGLSVLTQTAKYFKPYRTTGPQDAPMVDWKFPTKAQWTQTTFLAHGPFQPPLDASSSPRYLPSQRVANLLSQYQRFGYLPGMLMAAGVIAGVLPVLMGERSRQAKIALTFVITGLAILLVKAATAQFSYRFLVPEQELFWVGGVLGLALLVPRLRPEQPAHAKIASAKKTHPAGSKITKK